MHKVSVITPCSRPENVQRVKDIFLQQDYPNKELVILMDIPNYTKDMDIENNIYQWGVPGLTTGAKRNELCDYARGDIILHFDDDDTYATDWITYSVNALLNSKADLVGLDTAIFRNLSSNQRFQYIYKTGQIFILGATMCYWRKTWERAKFPDKVQGEDAEFCATSGIAMPHGYINGFEASIHPKNTCKRYTHNKDVWKLLTNP